MTSWGTTWPIDKIRSKPPCERSRLTWAGPRVVQLAFGLLVDELGRDLAEGLDIGAPVVDPKEFGGHIAVHVLKLRRLHGRMSAECGEDCFHAVAVVLPCVASEVSGAGMEAGHVGRNREHALPLAEFGQILGEEVIQVRRREIGVDSSYGAIQTHSKSLI